MTYDNEGRIEDSTEDSTEIFRDIYILFLIEEKKLNNIAEIFTNYNTFITPFTFYYRHSSNRDKK